jgi:hypothetical protein
MSNHSEAPPYYYIAFIDEAGDPGIERVRPTDDVGGTEWFVMGCTLIEAHDESQPVEWARSILADSATRRPAIHFRDLREWQKPLACQALAKLPVRLFAVCSNKKNMRQHKNKRAAAKSFEQFDKQYFFNFCARVILERVTDFVLRDSIARYGEPRLVKVIFSRRDGHSYNHMFAYNELLSRQSRAGTTWLGKRTVRWEVMNYNLLSVEAPASNAGLQLADIVASSFYQAVDMLPPTEFNPANARLLRPRMAQHQGRFEHRGVTFLPWRYHEGEIRPEQIDIFEFYGFQRCDFGERPDWW